jgi:hypothetical protein
MFGGLFKKGKPSFPHSLLICSDATYSTLGAFALS